MTTWGDGLFQVYRDLDSSGELVQIRIEMERMPPDHIAHENRCLRQTYRPLHGAFGPIMLDGLDSIPWQQLTHADGALGNGLASLTGCAPGRR